MQIKMKDKDFKKLMEEHSAKKIIQMHVMSEINLTSKQLDEVINTKNEINSTIEGKVYVYLCRKHCGKENLIKNQDLRNLFEIGSDKSMRKVIQNIRESKEFPLMIGSVSGKSGGFYICVTDEEKKETIDNIKHRANQMLRCCHVLEWKRGL